MIMTKREVERQISRRGIIFEGEGETAINWENLPEADQDIIRYCENDVEVTKRLCDATQKKEKRRIYGIVVCTLIIFITVLFLLNNIL